MDIFVVRHGSIHVPDSLTAEEAREWAKSQPDSAVQWDPPDWERAAAFPREILHNAKQFSPF